MVKSPALANTARTTARNHSGAAAVWARSHIDTVLFGLGGPQCPVGIIV
jgi:hypothetical protein